MTVLAVEDLERLRVRSFGIDDLMVDMPKAGTLVEQLEHELTLDDGTPEWRAWIRRAAARHRLV